MSSAVHIRGQHFPTKNVPKRRIFRLHWTHEMLTILTVCVFVCLSRGLINRRRVQCVPCAHGVIRCSLRQITVSTCSWKLSKKIYDVTFKIFYNVIPRTRMTGGIHLSPSAWQNECYFSPLPGPVFPSWSFMYTAIYMYILSTVFFYRNCNRNGLAVLIKVGMSVYSKVR